MAEKPAKTSFRWLVLLLVMCGVFLSTMDSGMISVALPTIMRSFRVGIEFAELVITLYLFTITVTLIVWGKAADLFGRVNIYLAGMTTFGLGAFSCYLSTSFYLLLFCRVVQGLGASMMMSSGPAIIKSVFPRSYLGRSLGLVGIATASGLLTGPFISGQLLKYFSWKAIFLSTLPVNIGAIIFGVFLFRHHLVQNDVDLATFDFDWTGCVYWTCLVALWLIGFHPVEGSFTLLNGFALATLVVVFYAFIKREKTASNPILPLFLFRERGYWVGVVTAAISFAALFSALVLIPFFLEYVLQLGVERVGFVMMALPATIIVFAPFSGWLYDRIGAQLLTGFGLGLSGLGIFSLAFVTEQSPIFEVMLKLAAVGAGQSIFLSPNSASVLASVEDRFTGISAGILATARNFGMVTGAALSVVLFSLLYGKFSGGRSLSDFADSDIPSFLFAWKLTFAFIAAASFFSAVISFRRS